MIHIRDVVGYITRISTTGRKRGKDNARTLDLTKVELNKELGKLNLTRPVIFAPPSMMAADLMARMQAMRIQMALVIDEYGGTEGLISLEDIVELIVGDIEDEHDDDEDLITVNEDGSLLLDARAEIEDIREVLQGKFQVGDHDEYAESIGGVIFSLLGRVPVKGEVVDAFGYEFRIREADPRRIKLIEMVVSKKAAHRKLKPGE
jgi:CBS domain containing-hemolysin-like protein